MNKRRKAFYVVCCCLVVLISCRQGTYDTEKLNSFQDQAITNLVTPYSDMSLLATMRSIGTDDADLVDWRVARFFALIQKIDFESMYPWHGAKISQFPVIIYHADNNTPQYYEFRVIMDTVEVGTITCNAKKSAGTPVAYVSEMSHKVTAETAKVLVSPTGDLKLSAVNYPSRFIMRDTAATARSVMQGETVFKDALTGKPITGEEVFIEHSIHDLLANTDEQTLEKLEITAQAKTEMLTEAEKIDSAMSELWRAIEEITPQILATTDEEVEREYQNPDAIMTHMTRYVYASDTTTVQRKMLDDWYNKQTWCNPGGWCGPAAVTFIALGLGSKAGCDKIPLWEDCGKIMELYNMFENTIGTGPKVISSLGKGLEAHTNYTIEQKLCHRWSDVSAHLNNYELPVVSLRSGWYGDWGFHYRVIIGTQTDRLRKYHQLSWWWGHWRTKYWTNDTYTYWYYMHDNGNDGGNFWETSGRVFQSTLGLVKYK